MATTDMFRISKTYCLPLMLVLTTSSLSTLGAGVSPCAHIVLRGLRGLGGAAHVLGQERERDAGPERRLRDVSPATFLIQITIIGRDVQVKVKDKAIQRFTLAAEMLIAIGWFNIFASIANIAGLSIGHWLDYWLHITEAIMVIFVTVFRFYYLSISYPRAYFECCEGAGPRLSRIYC